MSKSFPHQRKPCKDCPFRKDVMKGWLGKARITEILSSQTFTCHKTNDEEVETLQCAGHMLLRGEENQYVRFANKIKVNLELTGRELVFDTEFDCLKHHTHEHE